MRDTGCEIRDAGYRIRSLVWVVLLLLFPGTSFSQNPVTLKEAIATGLKNNYSILLQINEAEIAANNNTLGNAGFLPSLTLNASQNNNFSNTHQETSAGTVKDINNAIANSFNAGVALNWTLFDGLSMFVNKKMLGILEDLGENGTRLVMEGTVSDITMTYYAIIQREKMVSVLQEAVDLSLQRKRIAEAKLSIGAGSQLMLLQSTVDLHADSTRLIQQQALLANTRVDLNRLLGLEVTSLVMITDSIVLTDPGSYDTLLKKALAANTVLIEARLQQGLMRQEVKSAQSDRYPSLFLSAGYNANQLNSQTGYLQFSQSYGPSIGVSLSYNLFNGFDVNRAIKNTKVLVSSSDLEFEDSEQEVRASLLKTRTDYTANKEIIGMQQVNVQVAAQNVEVAFEKYKLGSLNDIELREIQKKLIDAQYELILSTYEAKKAETELLRLSGLLLSRLK
ncbi:MAG: TolC family protein [bacterium]